MRGNTEYLLYIHKMLLDSWGGGREEPPTKAYYCYELGWSREKKQHTS